MLCIPSVRYATLNRTDKTPTLGDGKVRSAEYQQYQNTIVSDRVKLFEENEETEVSDLCYKI